MGMASPESSCLLIIASENVKKVSKSQVWEKELDLNISEEECNVFWDHTNKKKIYVCNHTVFLKIVAI